jgi:hypothetical protein
MTSVKPLLTINTLKMIYYSYFHSVTTYGLLSWGNSPDSLQIFRLQKKIIRITTNCRYRDSCRKLFIYIQILPLPSQYIFSLLMFMIRNRSQFMVNSELHHINTRQQVNVHQPSVNVTKYQKGVYYLGIKVFNALTSDIKLEFNNPKKFKVVLKKLYEKSFILWRYTLIFRSIKFCLWIHIFSFLYY